MKKPACWALVLVLSLCALLPAQGETITDLLAQVPERLLLTVTADSGAVVTVDAPVLVPDTQALPILLAQSQLFNMTKVYDYYPLLNTSTYDYYTSSATSDRELWLHCVQEEKSYLLRGRTDVSLRYPLPMGETPPENDFSLAQAVAMILYNNALFGGDPAADLRPSRVIAMSGLCRMTGQRVTVGTGVSFTMMMPDPNQPIENREKGLWRIEMAQYFHNARVLPAEYGSSGIEMGDNHQFLCYDEPTANASTIMDENNFHITLRCLAAPKVLQENAPLCAWETVKQSIEALIRTGKLKSVYQVELGYQIVFLRSEYGAAGIREEDVHYVLMPCWEIKGDAENRYNRETFAESDSPDRETILMNGFGWEALHEYNYNFLLNAQTAQPVVFEDLMYELEITEE